MTSIFPWPVTVFFIYTEWSMQNTENIRKTNVFAAQLYHFPQTGITSVDDFAVMTKKPADS